MRSVPGSMAPWTAAAAVGALLVGLAAAPLPAQEVVVETRGAADVAVDRRLVRLLAAGPLVVARDTFIAQADTIPRSVLVLDATLVLEGTILGDLVLVDAGAFVRPRSVVRGDLVNIAGGLYRSELARVGGTILDLPAAPYRVIREPDRIIIEASATPARLVLDGFMGLHTPRYDRVDGLTQVWGARYRLPRLGDVSPTLHGQVGWHTQRGEPTYAAGLTFGWIGHGFRLRHERVTDTNERWIRSDLRNSLNYFWRGLDYRDYHAVDRTYARIAREFGDAGKNFHAELGLRFQVEDARSLRAAQPWHIWRRDGRENPPIDDGRITSALADLDLTWDGAQTAFIGHAALEQGLEQLDGAARFRRLLVHGDFAMLAFLNHTVAIGFHLQMPLPGDSLPRQRWSFVGGPGTIQTADMAEFRGDHVVYVESQYIVPIPERFALPLVGAPDVHLVHGAGMAWTDQDPSLRQEVGLRLQFLSLYGRFMVQPEDLSNHSLHIGAIWPFGRKQRWR